MDYCTIKSTEIDMAQNMYTVTLRVANMQVQNNKYVTDYYDDDDSFIYASELGTGEVIIVNC